jgi:ATP-binding cassette subfamily B (MDR/TAP) protein 1
MRMRLFRTSLWLRRDVPSTVGAGVLPSYDEEELDITGVTIRDIVRANDPAYMASNQESKSKKTEFLEKLYGEVVQKIQSITQNEVQRFLQHACSFVLCLALSLVFNWKLAIVLVILLSSIVLLSKLILSGVHRWTANARNANLSASLLVEEVLNSRVEMVLANGCQEYELDRYRKSLENAVRMGMRAGHLYGLGAGALYFALYGSFAFAFWYGGYLRLQLEVTPGTIVHVFYLSVVGAYSLQKLSPRELYR